MLNYSTDMSGTLYCMQTLTRHSRIHYMDCWIVK